MAQTRQWKANAQLYKIVAKSITPVVLIAGLLLFAVYHFALVIDSSQAQQDLFQGITSLSLGKLEVDFRRDAGIDRPAILYDRFALMTYADWNSVISIDGQTQELWNNFHGYSLDAQHNEIFGTTSGRGWQLTEVVKLVDEHTVTVTYQITARHVGAAFPHRIALSIEHLHNSDQNALWYYPAVRNNTFSAEELSLAAQNPSVPYGTNKTVTVYPTGTTTLRLSGPAAQANGLVLKNATSGLVHGRQQSWASDMVTNYVLENPVVDELMTLGTETITFHPAGPNSGTPVILPIPPTSGD